MPLTNGSGSGSWIRILLFSSLTFKMPAKNKFFHTILSACYFLKVNFYYFSKIKSQKESQNSRIQGFSYYFCMMIEGSGSESRAGSGSIPLTSGSGSGRPKNMWIRWIRIRIHPDSDPDSDPSGFGSIRIWIRIRIHPDSDRDPEHCIKVMQICRYSVVLTLHGSNLRTSAATECWFTLIQCFLTF
jgi:hypothetical protein